MKTFGGQALFLDRNDINTDEIIPAKYLTENSKDVLGPYCFEDLKLPGFDPRKDVPGKGAVISRANFGCGSSREHAPWTLEQNGIYLVVAESFARIFRQNMYNCGMIAVELDRKELDLLFREFSSLPTTLSVNIENGVLEFQADGKRRSLQFSLSEFEKALIKAGGWVEYAAKRY